MKKSIILTVLLISLTLMSIFVFVVPIAKATDVSIISVSPSTQRGKVGEETRIIGTLNTTDGLYQVWFGNQLIANETAVGNNVNVNFTSPELPGGNYTVTLTDVSKNINATTWFFIDTAYYIEAIAPVSPEQLQEGDTVGLNVAITGGDSNSAYVANITVTLPSPASAAYSALVTLTNTTNTGSGYANITYPNASLFQPSGAHTNFTGLYHVYFNKTSNLAEDAFFVGFTNSSEYHREDLLTTHAIGYQPNEPATVTITYPKTNATVLSETVNASEQGIISATWTVPLNASIGDYNITIIAQTTAKQVLDSQLFSVPGYSIKVVPRNLAGDVIPQILVEALDEATNTTFSNTSETSGIAYLQLEKGNNTLQAFWNKVKVGEAQVGIVGEDSFNLTCELTNLKITVKDKDGILIPFVNLNITYQYLTTKDNTLENKSVIGQTDLLGVFSLNSTLPHIDYVINATRYGVVFNINNNTVADLPAEPSVQITIFCPPRTLTIRILEYHRNPLPNAQIEMIEQMGGIFYSVVSDGSGIASVNCTLGEYTLRVYVDQTLLNETSIAVFNDTQNEIYCSLYNLTISVRVVDYFGQAIPNANVTLRQNDLALQSALALSDGVATFDQIIGGTLQITAYLPGQTQSYVTMDFLVSQPTQIEIRMDKYVMLAGFPVDTTLLTTSIIIVLTAILILGIEVYRRRSLRPKENES